MTNARNAKTAREKAAQMRAEAQKAEARRRAMLVTAAVAGVLAIVVAAFVIVRVAQNDRAATTAAGTPANLTNNGFVLGNTTAKVTIEIYEDFQCPACKLAEEENKAQLDGWVKAGTAKIVYKPVAILDRYSSTAYSTRAANAAAAVINADPTKFKAFHDLLYANQPQENTPGLTDQQLIDYAVQAGVDKAKVEKEITGQTFKAWTQTATEAFSKAGFQGTPTFVVNGKKLDSYDAGLVKQAVEAAGK